MIQTSNFDSIKQINPYGIEYWSARDLMPLLGYKKWQKFEEAIKRAMTSCEQSGNIVGDHSTGAGKVTDKGRHGHYPVADYNLSQFACYLIAQNGDPRKPEIATAQAYFAVSTRAHEIDQLREAQKDRC
jgi:DNA-damage-inducible protein D